MKKGTSEINALRIQSERNGATVKFKGVGNGTPKVWSIQYAEKGDERVEIHRRMFNDKEWHEAKLIPAMSSRLA